MSTFPTVIRSLTLYILGSLVLSCSIATVHAEPCFPTSLGFKDEWPFDASDDHVPSPVEKINPIFEFYGPGRDKPVKLDYKNLDDTPNSIPFDPDVPTKFIIHGFANVVNETEWITDMRHAFLDTGDYNIVLVGWASSFPQYVRSVCNSRVVARLTVKVIEMLQRKGLDLDDLHLIGHSLGAHISSYVGHLMGSKVARITGLDPAGPWFDTFGEDARLDPSDAQFVDVIHANGHFLNLYGGFGLFKQSGHVDFYANGGEKQPGCHDGLGGGTEALLERVFSGDTDDLEEDVFAAVACSHGRAYEIFTESIKAGSCFRSFACPTYDDFEHGRCDSCGTKGCNFAGLQASPFAEVGKQFFQTNSYSPFCSRSIEVTITPSDYANALAGHLILYLRGTSGQDAIILAEGDIDMRRHEPWTVVKPIKRDIGEIESGGITYKRKSFFSRRRLWVAEVTLKDMNTGKRYITRSPFLLATHVPVILKLEED